MYYFVKSEIKCSKRDQKRDLVASKTMKPTIRYFAVCLCQKAQTASLPQVPLIKGGFRGIVYMRVASYACLLLLLSKAQKKREPKSSLFLFVHSVNYSAIITNNAITAFVKRRRLQVCHKSPLSKGDLEGLSI